MNVWNAREPCPADMIHYVFVERARCPVRELPDGTLEIVDGHLPERVNLYETPACRN